MNLEAEDVRRAHRRVELDLELESVSTLTEDILRGHLELARVLAEDWLRLHGCYEESLRRAGEHHEGMNQIEKRLRELRAQVAEHERQKKVS